MFKKYKNKIFILIFVLFIIYIIYWALIDEESEEAKEEKIVITENKKEKIEKKEEKDVGDKVIIDIKGEVNNPGVYELKESNNVNDAINVAGGLTKKSDTSNINLSKKLTDEMVIIVYSKDEINKMKQENKVTCPPCNDALIVEEKSKITTSDTKININTAGEEELTSLDGIGQAKAQAIIEYRNQNNGFKSIDELKNVSGIGENAFEKIKDKITI